MSQSNCLVLPRPAVAEHLPADLIHRTARTLGVSFRDRIFTPAVTPWAFLSQFLDRDHSCRQAVARLPAFRSAHGLRPCSPDTGAYCKARGRLPEQLLRELTRATGRRMNRGRRRSGGSAVATWSIHWYSCVRRDMAGLRGGELRAIQSTLPDPPSPPLRGRPSPPKT
jgi:hypothetical protein